MTNISARSQRKIDSIVDQASRLFVRFGYHKVTMESVAQYANVSKVTLYKYFSDKLALYEHILLEQVKNDEKVYKEIITSYLPYHEKVLKLFQHEYLQSHRHDVPQLEDDVILSIEASKQYKQVLQSIHKMRLKLYNQGRMEEFISERVSDKLLEHVYTILTSGLTSSDIDLSDLSEDEFMLLLQVVSTGLQKNHEK